jgi:hypothetical protein
MKHARSLREKSRERKIKEKSIREIRGKFMFIPHVFNRLRAGDNLPFVGYSNICLFALTTYGTLVVQVGI